MQFFSQIVLAGTLGAFLGIERAIRGRDAGLRTSSMIAASACFITILSYNFPAARDTSRIASQIITGVGFLGAGVLLKGDRSVHGLTTAANILMAAAIGMCVGIGEHYLATLVTVFTLGVLIVLKPVSMFLRKFGEEIRMHGDEDVD